MGEPDTRYWINRGAVALLGCECGEVGCWPLNAQVFHDGGLVTWRGFAQPFRPNRDHGKFGPIVFLHAHYKRAVRAVVGALAAAE